MRAYVEPFFLPFLQNKGNLQSLSEHKESTENKSVKYLHIFIDFFLILPRNIRKQKQKKMTQRMVIMGMFWDNDNNIVTDFCRKSFKYKIWNISFYWQFARAAVPAAQCNFWCQLPKYFFLLTICTSCGAVQLLMPASE